MRLTRAWAPP